MTDLYKSDHKPASQEIVSLNVRMPKEMREAFNAHCAKHNVETSKVIRRFIEAELLKALVS